MHISQIKKSTYLTKEDCGSGILLTIKALSQEDIALEGNPQDMQWVMHFAEAESKPFILKTTNAVLIANALGSEETDEWIGRKIVLFADPTVMMKGKAVGGIRARAPKNQPKTAGVPTPKPKPAPAPEPEPAEPVEDDVPF